MRRRSRNFVRPYGTHAGPAPALAHPRRFSSTVFSNTWVDNLMSLPPDTKRTEASVELVRTNLSGTAKQQLTTYVMSLYRKGQTKLPPENDLAKLFGVSRITIRRALGELEREGLVLREQGRGTFINPASASIKINLVPGEEFTKLIAESGHQATITVVDISTRPAVLDEAERLGVAPGTKLCSVEKLYFADGTPAIISVDRFPTSLVKNLPTAEYLSAHPIFDFLRDEAGVAIVRDKIELESITHLRACQLAKAGAQLRCETALTFNSINYNRDNVPVMVNTEIYDTSIVKFELLRVKDVC